MIDLFFMQNSLEKISLLNVVFAIIFSFVLSFAIGFTYVKTFKGLSYSRNFVQAIMLGSIVAATVMHSIGDSLARGLGMIGALAIIRFRTNLKDPRDIIFMFASLASGIACGVGAFAAGMVGTLIFMSASFLLYFSQMTRSSFYDGILRFNIDTENEHISAEIALIMKKHCKIFALITLKEICQGKKFEYAYHIKIRKSSSNEKLVSDLKKISEINGVSLMLQETTVEL